MAITQRLDLRQTQGLVMTPQLQQAIRLLQFSAVELAEWVDQEISQNPLLERDEAAGDIPADTPDAPVAPEPEAPRAEPDGFDEGDHEPDTTRLSGDEAAHTGDGALDQDYAGAWADDGPARADSTPAPGDAASLANWQGNGGRMDFSDDDFSLEGRIASEASLRTLLEEQAGLAFTDPADRLMASLLIDQLDEAGRMAADINDLAARLGCAPEALDRVWHVMKGFEPTGIFARDLAECLALQLAERNRLDPAMQALLDNLDMLAAREMKPLMKLCGVDRDDLMDMVAEIRALEPRPVSLVEGELARTVVPDILMRPDRSGGWVIELNPDTLPRVLANESYYAQIRAGARGREAQDYLAERWAHASWLVKALDQRQRTIIRVAGEIVRHQDGFFHHGISGLRPLTLKQVAEAIDMHESTVSRVTSNKFIATPRGLFELKYFFTQALSGNAGEGSHSAETVRHRIRGLIDAEQPGKILSDDSIVDILRQDGIDIARRTVAKYREGMNIPSSVQRRREKAAGF